MGRPMRPIDPADGTIQAFAAELRDLREQAGRPPFRLMARRAHYSATTLSVACAGSIMPSLAVTLAFVRACGGPEDYWRGRWQQAAPARPAAAGPGPAPATGNEPATVRTRRFRRPLGIAALALVAALAGAAGWSVTHQAAANAAGRGAATELYVGVSPCDVGAVIVSQASVTLPSPLRLAGHVYPAGTVVGEVALRFSRRCALAWTRFLPAPAFASMHSGSLVLQSRRVGDGATTTVRMSPVVAAEGDPLLTVPGCVLGQATVRFGAGLPVATAATGCYP
jgi:Helix-turn-helix domain